MINNNAFPHVSHPLRWGILGTGAIAHSFAKALLNSNTGELVAVGSRTAATAERFADEFGVANRHASYQSLVADPEVDAIYIALPNHLHLEWVIRCAEAGKHILCEKPLASNYAEAMVAVEAAHYHDVFLMEAFMYRCHPQTARLAELVRQHVIGDVRLIEARFSFNVGQPRYDQFRHQSASAGGGIMDVGCYCTSAARLIAGASTGKDVAEPLEVKGCAYLDPIGRIDEWASAVCRFPGDIIANLTCGMMVSVDSMVAVWGSDGHILVPNPWFPGEKSEILLFQQKEKEPQKIEVITGSPLYTIEADTVARSLERRQASAPCMTWDDSLGNMKTLDCWRKDVGLVFDNERPEALRKPFTICPVARRPLPKMTYGRVDGVTKPISRLVMGTMVLHQANMPFACALLDHYVELGGNCLDTAYVYNTEGIVGRWLKLRDNRDSIVLITKGAHTPYCYPEALTRELLISLERFQTDYTDLYFMHRDNLDVPVGEFVECLNEHKRAERIHAFGGSNWTIERIQAANEYAHAHGLVGFTASSPNFSLGVWNEPMWAGCVSAVDPASRSWYQHSQMPLFAWSSQASGFFTGRYKCDDRSNPALADLVCTWFNEANFRRLERAQQLAADKGVTSAEVALAYVLSQPLNIFALIGPRTLGETRISAQALELTLTAEEMRWLNLEI